MKKIMSFLMLSAIIVSQPQLNAQISITATDINNWYAVGKALKSVSRFDTTTYLMNIGISSTSQAQAWTMPSVQFTDTLFVTNVTPLSTPYFSKFPLATHATIATKKYPQFSFTFYTYVRISGDSLYFLGTAMREVSGTKDSTTFTMSDEIILLPYSIGTILPSKRDSSYYGPGNYSIINSAASFDAFGTITFPNGTFQCLR
ncbi:MAG TPA: hypothetical protein VNJ29_01295, partial [Candidatus Nitrosotenuis sp.]|nr:hypothetical protein [Candidatus Nitrosotenuis sp.]